MKSEVDSIANTRSSFLNIFSLSSQCLKKTIHLFITVLALLSLLWWEGYRYTNTIIRLLLLDTYTITGFVNFSDPLIAIAVIFVHGLLLRAIICSEEYSAYSDLVTNIFGSFTQVFLSGSCSFSIQR